jgi:hypothetical protein
LYDSILSSLLANNREEVKDSKYRQDSTVIGLLKMEGRTGLNRSCLGASVPVWGEDVGKGCGRVNIHVYVHVHMYVNEKNEIC